MTLTNLTWEELERHLEQARIAQQSALKRENESAYRDAEQLEENIIAERVRRQQAREEPDTQIPTL